MTEAQLFQEYIRQMAANTNVGSEVLNSDGEKIGEFCIEVSITGTGVSQLHTITFYDGSKARLLCDIG